jgi:hypothetical protein
MVSDLEDWQKILLKFGANLRTTSSMLAECFMTASSPSKKYYGLRTRDTDTGTLFSK